MARPFHQIVAQIGGGEFAAYLDETIQAGVRAAHETGKSSKVTLTLEIKPIGLNAVTVLESVKLKVAERPKTATVFFNTEEGDLSREDPRQHKLPLRTIEAEANKETSVG